MLRVVPFEPRHLAALGYAPDLAAALALPADGRALAGPFAGTALDGPRIVACGGLSAVWPGRAMAWAAIDDAIGPVRFAALDRRVRTVLAEAQASGFARIEAVVDPAAPRARALRWARSLGFVEEARLARWAPDGRDMLSMVLLPEPGRTRISRTEGD